MIFKHLVEWRWAAFTSWIVCMRVCVCVCVLEGKKIFFLYF